MPKLSKAAALLLLAAPAFGLTAAAGKVDVTPDLAREPVRLAGYGSTGRRAAGVHDPLFARAVVVSDGRRKAALVSVDSIGLFREDVLDIRRRVGWKDGEGLVFISATHTHSAPDTLGLWGPLPGVSGVHAGYHERLKGSIARLIRELERRQEPARISAARASLDPTGLCRDVRDPNVLDPELNAVSVAGKAGPLATIVRWSCHPVALTETNLKVSADFPGPLCARVERERGGTCLFFPGLIGGHLIPDTDRTASAARQFEEAARIGGAAAEAALAALRASEEIRASEVAWSSATLRLRVDNSRYLLFLPSLAFGHRLEDQEGRTIGRARSLWLVLRHLAAFPLPAARRPWIETEVSRLSLGGLEFIGVPGEMFPELALGYDARLSFRQPPIDPANPNPPRLSDAPKPPYLREKVRARHALLVGMANDEIGYLIPEYDFKINDNRFMAPEPEGTHYGETNSLGISAAGRVLSAYDALLKP